MDVPYSQMCGSLVLPDELLDDILQTDGHENQVEIFTDYISIVESPYELYGLMWGHFNVGAYPIDVEGIILDLVATRHDRWDDDEVACFLLEVLDDHATYGQNLKWLMQVNMPQMLNLEYASVAIWDMFWEGHAELVLSLIEFYGWRQVFSQTIRQARDQHDPATDPDFCFYAVVAKQFDENTLVNDPNFVLANSLRKGLELAKRGDHFRAIETLLRFHDAAPDLCVQNVRRTLALNYAAVGWRELALQWITKSLESEPDNGELLRLYAEIANRDVQLIDELRDELRNGHPHLTSDSLEALTQAEFVFRYYGSMLGDYSIIATNLGRALEIQLRSALLPKLRSWIKQYGKVDENGVRFILSGTNKLSANAGDRHWTLGVWANLFDQPWSYKSHNTPDNFYHCILAANPRLDTHAISVLGSRLTRFKDMRNGAAHATFRNWPEVREMRRILLDDDLFRLAKLD